MKRKKTPNNAGTRKTSSTKETLTIYERCWKWAQNQKILVTFLIAAAALNWSGAALDNIAKAGERIQGWTARLIDPPPFPEKLTDKDIDGWSTGRLRLAELQIKGYLGLLEPSEWLQHCLQNKFAFPRTHQNQFNTSDKIAMNDTDEWNLNFLAEAYQRTSTHEYSKINSINSLYKRVAERSKYQLLHYWEKDEVKQLTAADLYLLRNEIYARHGRPFSTSKLRKYFSRQAWYQERADFRYEHLSPVEICNAFFLQQLSPARDQGEAGRGVHIKNQTSVDLLGFQEKLKTKIEALPEHMETFDRPGQYRPDLLYKENVDLIITIRLSAINAIGMALPLNKAGLKSSASMANTRVSLETVRESLAALWSKHTVQFWRHMPERCDSYLGLDLLLTQDSIEMLASALDLQSQLATILARGVVDILRSTVNNSALVDDSSHVEACGLAGPASTAGSKPPQLQVIEEPLPFDGTRQALSVEYLKERYGVLSPEPLVDPRMVVIHWTATENKKAALDIFKPSRVTTGRNQVRAASPLNVSAHFLVDRDGTIYRLLPETVFARHVIGLNSVAIGIENVGGTPRTPLTESQLHANEILVRYLKRSYDIKWLIGHQEYKRFQGSSLWQELSTDYLTDKNDPDPKFMEQLRNSVKDLGLKSEP